MLDTVLTPLWVQVLDCLPLLPFPGMLTQSSTLLAAPWAQESSLMKTLGLEKILSASSIWESFLSSSTRLF